LSWWLPDGFVRQRACRLEARIDERATVVLIELDDSVLVPWPFAALSSRDEVSWRVQVLGDDGWSAWSDWHAFEVGLVDRADWVGMTIGRHGDDRTFGPRGQRPAIELRTQFTLTVAPRRARLYATALGIYELHLDGVRVGDMELTPGFTAYRSTLEVQAFEVTDLLAPGEHELVATLTDGWYRGSVGFTREECAFGERLGLLAQLELVDPDGSKRVIATGPEWEASTRGPIRAADLMEGQRVDLRIPFPPTEGWDPVESFDLPADAVITASPAPPVRAVREVRAESVRRLDDGRQVISLPANINGWVRVEAAGLGPAGTTVRLSHGEVLDDDGDVDMRQLNVLDVMTGAPLGECQIDEVVSAGPQGPPFEPRHTTHGFQYVRVEGAPDLTSDDVVGKLVHTDMVRTGWFGCSDERLVRLHEAAVLSFVDNACDIPTDCPQRERAGWTGDWQIFTPTAAFLYDVAGFTDRWLRDLAADQWPDGRVTNHVPDPVGPAGWTHPIVMGLTGSAGWGDAATLVPFEMWRAYGDLELLRRQYPSMVAWVEYGLDAAHNQRHPTRRAARPREAEHERFLWDAGFHWGEWCEPGVEESPLFGDRIDQGHVATAYLARSLDAVAATASLLADEAGARKWFALAAEVRRAWSAEYVDEWGHVVPRTQANLCRALAFDLVPAELRLAALEDLVALITEADFHVGTGFLTTPFLLPTLADEGRPDVAYRLLLQDSQPSWLAMVEAGATTIWESWEGVSNDIHSSLNHYSKGAVVSFLHRYVGGIRMLDGQPAYQRFEVRPVPGGDLTWADAELDSPYGRIRSSWHLERDRFVLDARVPPGTSANVVLPNGDAHLVGPGAHTFAITSD
jgi:alpha-L-rhamnosidase